MGRNAGVDWLAQIMVGLCQQAGPLVQGNQTVKGRGYRRDGGAVSGTAGAGHHGAFLKQRRIEEAALLRILEDFQCLVHQPVGPDQPLPVSPDVAQDDHGLGQIGMVFQPGGDRHLIAQTDAPQTLAGRVTDVPYSPQGPLGGLKIIIPLQGLAGAGQGGRHGRCPGDNQLVVPQGRDSPGPDFPQPEQHLIQLAKPLVYRIRRQE